MKHQTIGISLALFLFASTVIATELSTNEGEKFSGEFVSIDTSDLVFKTKDGEQKFLLTKLNLVDLKNPATPPGPAQAYTLVEFVDGSVFRCKEFTIKKKTAYLTLFSGRSVEVSWEKILFFYRGANNLKTQQEFLGIMKNRPKADLYLRKQPPEKIPDKAGGPDKLGPEKPLAVVAQGTFGDGSDDGTKIAFKESGEEKTIELPTERVTGIIYNPPNTALKATVCRVIDTDDNSIVAHKIVKTEKGFTITTLSDVIFILEEKQVSRFDFAAGGVKYLSDLEPATAKTESTASEVVKYQRDKNLDGKEISLLFESKPGILERRKFDKGLTLPTKTTLDYDLKGLYKNLKATVGVDASADADVAVKLSFINLDNGVVLQSMIIKKGEKPTEVNLGITGVGSIRMIAESTEPLDFGQQISLGRARVEK